MKPIRTALTTCLLLCAQAFAAAGEKPNILVILADDLSETKYLAAAMPEKVAAMNTLLEKLITADRSTPGAQQKNDVEVVRYPRAAAAKRKARAAKQKNPQHFTHPAHLE